MVVLPTPPFPVTNSSLRSSSAVKPWTTPCQVGRSPPQGAERPGGRPTAQKSEAAGRAICVGSQRAEADPPVLGASAQIDVGELVDGHSHLVALAIGQPEHRLAVGHRLLDARLHGIGIRVVGQLDLDLPGDVSDTDANLHGLLLERGGVVIVRATSSSPIVTGCTRSVSPSTTRRWPLPSPRSMRSAAECSMWSAIRCAPP